MPGDMKTVHAELRANVSALDYNCNRAINGNKSSHTAYRSQLQDIKKLCDKLRKLTLEHQKALPTKTRTKKTTEKKAEESDDEKGSDSRRGEAQGVQVTPTPQVSDEDDGVGEEEVKPKSKRRPRRKAV